MKINKESFEKNFLELSGKKLDIKLPETFEELFDIHSDPTDFHFCLKWLILTTQYELTKDKPLNKIYEPYQINNSFVFLGNVKISGDFHIDHHTYIVGNLEVEGVIYGDVHYILVVGGSIHCEGMLLCRTYVFVLGDITINQCALFITYGSLQLEKKLYVPLYIQDNTWMICEVMQDPISIENPSFDRIQSYYFFEVDINNSQFLNQLTDIVGKENVKIHVDGYWSFDEFFNLISSKNKIIK